MGDSGIQPDGSWIPAFDGQQPPFEPGNTLALTHGAYSPRRVDPLATELVTTTIAAAAQPEAPTGYLIEPSYRPALWAWARCEARIQLLTEWLIDQGGDIDDDGEVLAAAKLLEKLERQAITHRQRLGLDPLSRAQLGRDVASAGGMSVAQLMAALGDEERRQEDTGT